MNTDIRLHIEFFQHAKTVRMMQDLGLQGAVSLLTLWCYTAKHRADGVLRDMDSRDIEIAAAWPQERKGEFFAYCTKNGWLDKAGRGTWQVHEWYQYNPWAAEAPKRTEEGKRGAHERHHVKRGVSKPDQCPYCREAISPPIAPLKPPYSDSNAPAPAPNPTPVVRAAPEIVGGVFAEVWKAYPKTARGDEVLAQQVFCEECVTDEDTVEILRAVKHYAKAADPAYVAKLPKWLREWRNWVPAPPKPAEANFRWI